MSSKFRYSYKAKSGREYIIHRGDAVLNADKHVAHRWYYTRDILIDENAHVGRSFTTEEQAKNDCESFDENYTNISAKFYARLNSLS